MILAQELLLYILSLLPSLEKARRTLLLRIMLTCVSGVFHIYQIHLLPAIFTLTSFLKVPEAERSLVQVMDGKWTPTSVIRDLTSSGVQEDPFYVMTLDEVVARYNAWKDLMPRVEPFYGKYTD